jgi:uncharacterized membrane protein YesL
MKYFKSKRDVNNYSKAFAEYRQEWVEENIKYLLLGGAALIVIPLIISKIRKMVKGGAAKYEHNGREF